MVDFCEEKVVQTAEAVEEQIWDTMAEG